MRTSFIAVFCIVAGFLGGMEAGWRQREAEPDKIVTLTKACPAPARYTAWACDAVERREYASVCLKRKAG